MRIYNVRVRPEVEWETVQVAGRHFSKSDPVLMSEEALTDEIMHSPLLIGEPVEEPAQQASQPKPEGGQVNSETPPAPPEQNTPPTGDPEGKVDPGDTSQAPKKPKRGSNA